MGPSGLQLCVSGSINYNVTLCACILMFVCVSESVCARLSETGREIESYIKGTGGREELFNGDLAFYPTSSSLDWWLISLDGHVCVRCVSVCCAHD